MSHVELATGILLRTTHAIATRTQALGVPDM